MVYDCITYNGEKDILDIRLAILDPFVDYFIICQSKQTFSGKEKEIYATPNNPKIVNIIAPNIDTDNAFERAFRQKEYLKTALISCNDDDIIYYGDTDEIWKPQSVLDKVLSLEQINYCYYLNNRSSERWIGTIVGKWGVVKTNYLAHWRATHTYVVKEGGWHFTNMGGVEQIIKKLEAYDHQEYNTEYVKEDVEYRMSNGEDYVGRFTDSEGKPFSFNIDESELPSYTLSNKQKYVAYFK